MIDTTGIFFFVIGLLIGFSFAYITLPSSKTQYNLDKTNQKSDISIPKDCGVQFTPLVKIQQRYNEYKRKHPEDNV